MDIILIIVKMLLLIFSLTWGYLLFMIAYNDYDVSIRDVLLETSAIVLLLELQFKIF